MPLKPDWIAVDWGTSNLRAWAMSQTGAELAHAKSDAGMARLKPPEFEPALLDLIGPWLSLKTPVIACGMVGARDGWIEAPYQAVPCTPNTVNLTPAPSNDPRLEVLIAPGLSQSKPADVMRGEETQIAGFLVTEPDFDGVLCLPGTHTKWVRVSAGEVVSFQTFMSGELFALLAENSVLRHSLSRDGWDEAAFSDALSDTLSKPASLGAKLFSLRAESLLMGAGEATTRAKLSGLLIGLELSGARPYWLGQEVAVLGAAELAETYATALATQGVIARTLPLEPFTLRGLTRCYAEWLGIT